MDVEKKLKVENTVECNDPNEEMWLSKLPDEVLVKILGMVPPLTLVALEKSDKNRFSNLAYDRKMLRNVDFSNYSNVSIQDMSDFFVPVRAALIVELNFNNCKWMGPAFVVKCVKKCQQIHTLSVMNCDLTFNALIKVIDELHNLVDLSWTARVERAFPPVKVARSGHFGSLKKLYFEFTSKQCIDDFLAVWDEFLLFCDNLQELEVHFILDSTFEYGRTFPFFFHSGEFMQRSRILKSFDSLTVTCSSGFKAKLLAAFTIGSLVRVLLTAKDPGKKWKKLWINHKISFNEEFCIVNDRNFDDFTSVKCLQLNCMGEPSNTVRILNAVPENSVEALGIHELELADTHRIIASCGKSLKRFVLNSCKYKGSEMRVNVLPDLFAACNNITELNIQGTHFFNSADSPCTAICNLKSLQKITLPSCAVKRVVDQQCQTLNHLYGLQKMPRLGINNEQHTVISNAFKDMVESCKLVTTVFIHGCMQNTICPKTYCCSEEDIDSMYLWEKLEYLHLDDLPNLVHCKFLEKVASNCKKFKILYLGHIGKADVCNYFQSLSILLSNAHLLSTLIIVGKSVNLGYQSIWESISCAKNLETLCFNCGYRTIYHPSFIIKCISQLPKLHTFRFCYFRMSNNTYDPAGPINSFFKSHEAEGNDQKRRLEVFCKSIQDISERFIGYTGPFAL